jgi:hypothetical protein
MLALLIVAPMRIRNFSNLRLNRHLRCANGRWSIELTAEETKTRRADCWPVPDWLAPYLTHHVQVVRLAMMNGKAAADPEASGSATTASCSSTKGSGTASRPGPRLRLADRCCRTVSGIARQRPSAGFTRTSQGMPPPCWGTVRHARRSSITSAPSGSWRWPSCTGSLIAVWLRNSRPRMMLTSCELECTNLSSPCTSTLGAALYPAGFKVLAVAMHDARILCANTRCMAHRVASQAGKAERQQDASEFAACQCYS